MSIIVKDIQKLESLKEMELVAGKTGLERTCRMDICSRMF